jgi:NADH dehydrogenase FAD-containing subunit
LVVAVGCEPATFGIPGMYVCMYVCIWIYVYIYTYIDI